MPHRGASTLGRKYGAILCGDAAFREKKRREQDLVGRASCPSFADHSNDAVPAGRRILPNCGRTGIPACPGYDDRQDAGPTVGGHWPAAHRRRGRPRGSAPYHICRPYFLTIR